MMRAAWRRASVAAVACAGGCFNPQPPANLPCAPDGSCPPGLVCSATSTCVVTAFDAPTTIDAITPTADTPIAADAQMSGQPFTPSNGVTFARTANASDVTVSGLVVWNTDTGSGCNGCNFATIDTGNEHIGVFSFASLRVPTGTGVELVGSRAAAIIVATTVTVGGVIDASPECATGSDCGGGPGGFPGGNSGLSCASGSGESGATTSGGGAGGGGGGSGGHGGGGGSATAGAACLSPTLVPLSGGGAGGASPVAAAGGAGGGLQITAGTSITAQANSFILALGNGGQGAQAPTDGGGGGGGGAGGGILLEAPALTISGTVAANGGGGGGGSLGKSGQNGSAGLDSTAQAAGGSDDEGDRSGGSGGSLTGSAGGGHAFEGGGGGGGSVGVIYLHGDQLAVASAVFSPAAGSGAL